MKRTMVACVSSPNHTSPWSAPADASNSASSAAYAAAQCACVPSTLPSASPSEAEELPSADAMAWERREVPGCAPFACSWWRFIATS